MLLIMFTQVLILHVLKESVLTKFRSEEGELKRIPLEQYLNFVSWIF